MGARIHVKRRKKENWCIKKRGEKPACFLRKIGGPQKGQKQVDIGIGQSESWLRFLQAGKKKLAAFYEEMADLEQGRGKKQKLNEYRKLGM